LSTDVFSINLNSLATTAPNVFLDESGIALSTDRDTLYKQVDGFSYVEVSSTNTTCSENGLQDTCKYYQDPVTGVQYLYYYPNDDTTQYLYEMYPNQISPIDGVTNEHFMVWMKPSILPTFRKLYGSINGSFESGQRITIQVVANYEVGSFDSSKTLILSSLGNYGGRNLFLGEAYLTVGILSLIYGTVMYIKHKWLCKSP
jgi:hypothetical protein